MFIDLSEPMPVTEAEVSSAEIWENDAVPPAEILEPENAAEFAPEANLALETAAESGAEKEGGADGLALVLARFGGEAADWQKEEFGGPETYFRDGEIFYADGRSLTAEIRESGDEFAAARHAEMLQALQDKNPYVFDGALGNVRYGMIARADAEGRLAYENFSHALGERKTAETGADFTPAEAGFAAPEPETDLFAGAEAGAETPAAPEPELVISLDSAFASAAEPQTEREVEIPAAETDFAEVSAAPEAKTAGLEEIAPPVPESEAASNVAPAESAPREIMAESKTNPPAETETASADFPPVHAVPERIAPPAAKAETETTFSVMPSAEKNAPEPAAKTESAHSHVLQNVRTKGESAKTEAAPPAREVSRLAASAPIPESEAPEKTAETESAAAPKTAPEAVFKPAVETAPAADFVAPKAENRPENTLAKEAESSRVSAGEIWADKAATEIHSARPETNLSEPQAEQKIADVAVKPPEPAAKSEARETTSGSAAAAKTESAHSHVLQNVRTKGESAKPEIRISEVKSAEQPASPQPAEKTELRPGAEQIGTAGKKESEPQSPSRSAGEIRSERTGYHPAPDQAAKSAESAPAPRTSHPEPRTSMRGPELILRFMGVPEIKFAPEARTATPRFAPAAAADPGDRPAREERDEWSGITLTRAA